VGVQAAQELKKEPPPGVLIVEVGTAVLDALHLFSWADKILALDAMKAGGSPGTIYSFRRDDVVDAGPQASLHEVNLLRALRLIPENPQPEIMILGVEPEIIDFGLNLSPTVQCALPRLLEEIRKIVLQWLVHYPSRKFSFSIDSNQ
jgi:hydrogenase maturation protease